MCDTSYILDCSAQLSIYEMPITGENVESVEKTIWKNNVL